jgi:hypothetical protein
MSRFDSEQILKKGGLAMNEHIHDADIFVVEAVDMGDVDTLEEEVLPLASLLCTGCSCTCS